jgi:hypothetical protein
MLSEQMLRLITPRHVLMLHMSQSETYSICTSEPVRIFMTVDHMTVVFGSLHA